MTYALASAEFRTPRGRSALMAYRQDTNDWNTLWACLNEDEYGLRDRKVRTAVDIGAYIGGVTVGLALDNPDCRVIAVEPVPANVELLRTNVERNGLGERVTVLEGAAGGKEPVEVRFGYRGSPTLEHHAFVGNSSLAYDNEVIDHDAVTYDEPITLSRIVELAGSIDLLKIDCEGGEYTFLDDPAAKSIPAIVGEFHPVRGKGQDDILALLPEHTVTFTGPEAGPGGFVAVR